MLLCLSVTHSLLNISLYSFYSVILSFLFLTLFQRCELCPQKEGALKRTDTGGKNLCSLFLLFSLGTHVLWKEQ